jgi:hypothetical protein
MTCSTAELEYAEHVELLRATEPILAGELAEFHGVEQVLQWMQQRGLIKPALDLVGQDEFSYDFVIEFEPNGRWLAFGVS